MVTIYSIIYQCAKFYNFPAIGSMGCHSFLAEEEEKVKKKKKKKKRRRSREEKRREEKRKKRRERREEEEKRRRREEEEEEEAKKRRPTNNRCLRTFGACPLMNGGGGYISVIEDVIRGQAPKVRRHLLCCWRYYSFSSSSAENEWP